MRKRGPLVHFTVPCTKIFIALGEMKRNTMNTDCTEGLIHVLHLKSCPCRVGRANPESMRAIRRPVPSRPHMYTSRLYPFSPEDSPLPGLASSLAEYTCQRLLRGAYYTLVPFYTRAGRLNQHLRYFAASAPGYKGSFARSTGMSQRRKVHTVTAG